MSSNLLNPSWLGQVCVAKTCAVVLSNNHPKMMKALHPPSIPQHYSLLLQPVSPPPLAPSSLKIQRMHRCAKSLGTQQTRVTPVISHACTDISGACICFLHLFRHLHTCTENCTCVDLCCVPKSRSKTAYAWNPHVRKKAKGSVNSFSLRWEYRKCCTAAKKVWKTFF